jgi:hypothetical protein
MVKKLQQQGTTKQPCKPFIGLQGLLVFGRVFAKMVLAE